MTYLMFVAGLLLLVAGAEALVRGASGLAASAGISPLIIGLTVVAFGTSSPELAISIKSALSGQPDIALGNVVGSNNFNILVILGASALISPLVVSQQLVRFDVPLMIGASVAVLSMGASGRIGRIPGSCTRPDLFHAAKRAPQVMPDNESEEKQDQFHDHRIPELHRRGDHLLEFRQHRSGDDAPTDELSHDQAHPLVNHQFGENKQRQRHQEAGMHFDIIQERQIDTPPRLAVHQ
jgi:hypothetical protein